METLLVPGNGTGIPLDRLLGHPLVQSLLIQAALPGRVFWSANPSGLVVAGCASMTSVLGSLREHRRAIFLSTVFALAMFVLAASFLVGAVQLGLVVVITGSFPALVIDELIVDQPAFPPQHGSNVHRRRSFQAILRQRACDWLCAVAIMSGIFAVSLVLVTGGGRLWTACASA